MAWTTPRTWSSGELVTALMMNTHVRDNENALLSFIPNSFIGLHLRTHPNSDVAANQVALLGLDQIVMSSGFRYSAMSSALPLTADITTSGAGGLDTGSRTASKWYEVWLIGKGTQVNSDLRLLLHRAKEYTLDQSQATNDTAVLLRSGATTNIKLAQSFKPGTTGACEFVDVSLLQANTPSGNVWFTIEADSSGAPSGTPLATSDKLNAGKIATAQQTVRVPFRTPASLTSGTTYWLVLQGDYSTSGTVNVTWYEKATTNPYANGTAATYNGTTWTNTANADMWFKTYVTVTNGTISYPAGWTESCKIGHVYNNGSNALVKFSARNRRVVQFAGSGSATGPLPQLTDHSAHVPPGPLLTTIHYVQSVGSNYATAAGVPDGYGALNATERDYGLELSMGPANALPQPLGDVATEFQAMYYESGGNATTFYITSYEWIS